MSKGSGCIEYQLAAVWEFVMMPGSPELLINPLMLRDSSRNFRLDL